MKKFAKVKGMNWRTFASHLYTYQKRGIEGLVPCYGHRKGKNPYLKSVGSIILEVFQPGKGYKRAFDKLVPICEREGIKAPSYDTFISLAKQLSGLTSQHYLPDQTGEYKGTIRADLRITPKNPLAALQQLKHVIERSPAISARVKEASLKLLDRDLAITSPRVCKYKPIRLDAPLTDEEIRQLGVYKSGDNKKYRDRATAILMANDNRTMLEILMEVDYASTTVYTWFAKFKKKRVGFVKKEAYRPNFKRVLAERANRIVDILHTAPKLYAINRTSWTYGTIVRVYRETYGKELSIRTVQSIIKETGYKWRRARRVLTSPDPEYRAKTKKVLDTLQNLGPNDAFCFIDEAGPWQVKKYGGKSLTPDGTIKTFPQFQTPKGRVTFIASLDAAKNQVTWFFTKSKDTDEVIRLIRILISEYHRYSTLYLTWDCASWHRSKKLQKFLEEVNSDKEGPTIKVVPLPKQSQFLNVIESVISGMKKAVIHNSDYQSEDEMKAAISRHFEERNDYFKENPKRAGNKIWDKEFFSLDEIEGGLFKKM